MKVFAFLVSLSIGTPVFASDFNTRLVIKLSEMMGVPAPKKIEIELLSQKELLEDYRGFLFRDCMSKHNRFEQCRGVDVSNVFVHGLWIYEKDPSHLHIKVHKNSGMDAVVHEFCHWYLYKLSPLLNNHTTLEALAKELLVSPTLIKWLEEEQK